MRSWLLMLGGLLLAAGAFVHAFVGWPPLRGALESHDCTPGLVGAVGASWTFGSVAMLTFAFLVLCDGLRLRRGVRVGVASSPAIGAAYVCFGAVAWFLRELNPHFLAFVVTGLVIGLPCLVRSATAGGGGEAPRVTPP